MIIHIVENVYIIFIFINYRPLLQNMSYTKKMFSSN